MRHIGEHLLERIDAALDEAVNSVRDGGAAKSTVSVTFTVSLDKEGEMATDYALKHSAAETGTWAPRGGARLPYEAREVA